MEDLNRVTVTMAINNTAVATRYTVEDQLQVPTVASPEAAPPTISPTQITDCSFLLQDV